MQPTSGGGSTSASGSGGGGVGELTRGGLARFRSAPATWLEALLEDEEEDPLLKPTQCLTQLLTENSSPSPARGGSVVPFGSSSADPSSFDVGFLRQNSSPADFLGNSDGFFSNFAISASFDLAASSSAANMSAGSPSGSGSSSKRAREVETLRNFSGNLSSPIKMEQGGHVSGLIDLEMEKLLEESVPCRVRAKRGCATHPRSIAERVRRTRISDRIRKLQELVPNMDKQTNTADMLDEAVEYVKCLQKQIQELSEHQRKCKCVNKE